MINKYNLLTTKFASKEKHRPAINGVYVTKEKTVGTNGYMLLEVETPKDKLEDFAGIQNYTNIENEEHTIPLDAAKQLENNLKKITKTLPVLDNAVQVWQENGKAFITTDLSQSNSVRYIPIEDSFPEYQTIIPQGSPKAAVKVDAKYLKQIAEAFSSIGNNDLEIAIYENDQPVVFRSKTIKDQDMTALLMPILK